MIYRIDLRHFMTHAIDYFTLQDLNYCNYVIISAKIQNGGRSDMVTKCNELYPPYDITLMFDEMRGHDEPFEAFYRELKEGKDVNYRRIMYQFFINPLIQHQNIMIICEEIENDMVDVICKFLHKEYGVDVIDLNELFSTGRTGEIYIDLKDIWDKAVDCRREAGKEMLKSRMATADGRAELLKKLSMKEKKRQLKQQGISITNEEKKDIDKILLEVWGDN